MALQFTYEDSFGNTNNSSYAKISKVNSDFARNTCYVTLEIYRDSSARHNGKSIVGSKSFNVALDKTRAEIYAILKGLPDCANAIDV